MRLNGPRRKSKIVTLKTTAPSTPRRANWGIDSQEEFEIQARLTRMPGMPRASASSLTISSNLLHNHPFSANETANGDSLVNGDVTASTGYRSRTFTSPKPSTQPAPLPPLARDSTHAPSTSASVLHHQESLQDPETPVMSAPNTFIIVDDDDDDAERHGSKTDDASLSYRTYGPPARHHFHERYTPRRDSSSTDESGGTPNDESRVTSTIDDKSRFSAGANADPSVMDSDVGESPGPNPTPERASFFGSDEVQSTPDPSRNSYPSSDAGATNSSVSAEPAKRTAYFSRGHTPGAQPSARRESGELEDLHRSTTSSSEHGSTTADDSEQERSNASSPAVSTLKPAQPQNDSQTSSDDLPLTSSPSRSDHPPASQTGETGASGDIATINTKIRDIEEKLANATEKLDRENARFTAISSETAVLRQSIDSRKTDLKDLFKQRRVLEAKIKDVKSEIKDSEIKLETKIGEEQAHLEARDNAQDMVNDLACQKAKQEKKLEIAREDEMRERSIADPFLRRLAKKLQSGRSKWGGVDSDSDGNEYLGSSDEQESDSEDESGASRASEDDDGNDSETGSSAGEGDPESKQDTMGDHLEEFIDNYSKLARKKPEKMTMAEFSSIGNAYTKIHGNVKPEIDNDDKSAVKSEIKIEIKQEPGIKTEANTTPETVQPTPISNIKHESSPNPFPGNNIPASLPALDDLSLTTLTADGLAEDIKLAQYYQAKVSKTFALLNAPITSPAADISGTQSGFAPGGEYGSSSRVTHQQSRRGSLNSDIVGDPLSSLPASDDEFHFVPARKKRRLDDTHRKPRKRTASLPATSDVDSDDEEEDPDEIMRPSGRGVKKAKLRHERTSS